MSDEKSKRATAWIFGRFGPYHPLANKKCKQCNGRGLIPLNKNKLLTECQCVIENIVQNEKKKIIHLDFD